MATSSNAPRALGPIEPSMPTGETPERKRRLRPALADGTSAVRAQSDPSSSNSLALLRGDPGHVEPPSSGGHALDIYVAPASAEPSSGSAAQHTEAELLRALGRAAVQQGRERVTHVESMAAQREQTIIAEGRKVISLQADQLAAVQQDAERVRLEACTAAAQIHAEAVVHVTRTEVAAYQLQQETIAGAAQFQATLTAQVAEQSRQCQFELNLCEARLEKKWHEMRQRDANELRTQLEGTLVTEREKMHLALRQEEAICKQQLEASSLRLRAEHHEKEQRHARDIHEVRTSSASASSDIHSESQERIQLRIEVDN